MTNGERVLLVDDHPIFRKGLRTVLETEQWIDVIVEADTVAGAVHAALEHQVTVAAMDVALPDGDGIEATGRILQLRPNVNILMLTMLDDEDLVLRALRAGAHGYARKDIAPEKLVQALSTVADGGVVLGPAIGRGVIATIKRTPDALPAPFDQLTDRERQILAHLANGDSNARIARHIGLTEKTVRNQVSIMFGKLGVPDRVRAALLVRDTGILPYLISPGTPA